jgi:FMN phosphatase YigB (HAD superfamily)
MNPRPVVLFDLGEVLVRLRFPRGMRRLLQLAGGDVARADDLREVFVEPFVLDWNAGRLSPIAFLETLCSRLGPKPVPSHEAALAWCDVFDPYPEMEALAQEVLDAGHETWLLSNTDPLHFARELTKIAVLHRFSGLHLSYEVGAAKPEPAFFERFLRRTGHAAMNCVFLDDRADFVAAARALGIRAQMHTGNVAATRKWLKEQGVQIA